MLKEFQHTIGTGWRVRFLGLMLIAVGCGLMQGTPLNAKAQTAVIVASPDATMRRWAGRYVYEDALGEIPAGSGTHASVMYKLRVPGSASQPVTLDADGFQTEDRLRCAIAGNAERIEVRFVSFADGGVKNKFGVAVYQPNDVLFTIERARDHGLRVLITEWKALKPNHLAQPRGHYFESIRSATHARKEE